MPLNITTDYALRIVLYLAEEGHRESVSGKEIAQAMGIPYNYFLKIIPYLKNAGVLESFQGKKGGYTLVKDPKDISMYELILAMEDDLHIAHCLKDKNACSRDAGAYCNVHKVFANVQKQIDAALQSAKIGDLIEERNAENI